MNWIDWGDILINKPNCLANVCHLSLIPNWHLCFFKVLCISWLQLLRNITFVTIEIFFFCFHPLIRKRQLSLLNDKWLYDGKMMIEKIAFLSFNDFSSNQLYMNYSITSHHFFTFICFLLSYHFPSNSISAFNILT